MSNKLAFALINLLLASNSVISAWAGDASSAPQLNHPSTNDNRQLQEDILSFQLKMYWEDGYYWQEEDFERRWCAQCQGFKCEEGDNLHVKKCDDRNRIDRQRFIYEEVPGSGGGRIKPYTAQDLCWTSLGADRARFELRLCDNNCRQIIVGIQYDGRFEMNPLGRTEDCLEQHHHPRRNEVIRASDCEQSRKDTTSYWVMINKQGTTSPTADTSTALYGDCSPHVPPTVPSPTDSPTTAGVATTRTAIASTTVAPPITTASTVAPPITTVATTVAPPITTVAATTVAPLITTVATTVAPPKTSATTVAPPISTTVASFSTQQQASQGSCELDENGSIGQATAHATSVDYFYKLVTDPAALVDSTIDDIIGNVGRNALVLLLPTIFGDDCTGVDSSGRRKLASMAVGAKAGSAEPVEGAYCQGQFPEGHNCTVVFSSMTVYTNGDENYDDALMPMIQDTLDSGHLTDTSPAIVKVAYITGETRTSSPSAESSGLDDTTKRFVAASVGAAALIVVIVALIVTKIRRKKLQSVTAAVANDAAPVDDAKPPTREVKAPIGNVYLSDISVPYEEDEWWMDEPNADGSRAQDGGDVSSRSLSYLDV